MFYFLNKFIIVALISIMVSTLTVSIAAQNINRQGDVSQSYRKLLAEKKYEQANKRILYLIKKRLVPKARQWQLHLDLMKSLRYQDRPQDALRLMRRLSEQDKQRPEFIAEELWLAMDQKQIKKRETLRNELESHHDETTQIYKGFFDAQMQFNQKQWQQCIKTCNSAIKKYQKLGQSKHPLHWQQNPLRWELRLIHNHLKKLLKEATNLWMAERFGQDYANYRTARFAQQDREYKKAIEYYRKIKGPILKDAAACYIPACLSAMKRHQDAIALRHRFIEDEEQDLYKGEVMFELGKLYLFNANDHDDLKRAADWFNRADNWIKQARRTTASVDVESIRAILKHFPVPKNRSKRDNFGNFHRNYAGPETIVNRLTCTWYLDQLECQTLMLHAFTLNELQQFSDSQAKLIELIQLDRKHQRSLLQLSDMPERIVADSKDGTFALPRTIWNRLSPRYALQVRLGAFFFMMGEHGRAEKLLSNVYQKVVGKPKSIHDWAAVEFLLGCNAFERNNRNVAKTHFSRFESVLKKTSLAPLAVLLHANILAGEADGYTGARERYLWVATEYRKTSLAPRALLSLLILEKHYDQETQAYEAWKTLTYGSYSDTAFAAVARTLESKMTRDGGKSVSASNDERGRIHRFQRHLVIPGHVDWTLNASVIQPHDILDYQVSYEVRVGCAMKSFWYSMNVFEPQPPATRKSPLIFMRIPMLGIPPS